MAKKKVIPVPAEETSEEVVETLTPQEAYNLHNHETAQAGDEDKQCQCDLCEEHRGNN